MLINLQRGDSDIWEEYQISLTQIVRAFGNGGRVRVKKKRQDHGLLRCKGAHADVIDSRQKSWHFFGIVLALHFEMNVVE